MDMEELRSRTLGSCIQILAEAMPQQPAFIFWSPTGRFLLSREDVVDLSSRFAYRLTQHGVKPGDVVCIALPNCPERIVAEFGIHLAGAISMNGQILRTDGEDMLDSMTKANAKVLVTNPFHKHGAWKVVGKFFEKLSEDSNHFCVTSQHADMIEIVEVCRFRSSDHGFLESLKAEGKHFHQEVKPDDVAAIFTTSGGAGYTKLVKHSHKNILGYGHCMTIALKREAKGHLFSAAPLGWLGGFPSHYAFSGCPRVLLDESQAIPDKPKLIWEAICHEDVTVALMVPLQFVSIHDRPELWLDKNKILQRILTGAQPIRKDHLHIIGDLAHSVAIVYGSTEAGIGHVNVVDESNLAQFKDYTVGHSLKGFTAKVVDDALNTVAVGTLGQIMLKSATLTQGYVDNPTASLNMLEDGWYRSDDIGYMTEDGQLVVEGRCSDAIMHGAYIFYPFWLEKKIARCPGVEEIVIVPIPDKILHHEICACVKPFGDAKLTPEVVLNFCRKEVALEDTSMLNVVPKHVIFLDRFPTTVTGRPNRKGLTEVAKDKLGIV